MLKINSFRLKVFILLGLMAAGIYTLISIPSASVIKGSVSFQDELIIDDITNQPYTGKVTDTVAGLILSYEVKNGFKYGEFTISLLDGNKTLSGKIINNKNEGKWSYYYTDGNLESEGFFKNDIATDKWIWYYPNGNIKEEGQFINGKREGMWKMYNDDGSLKANVLFKNGDIVNSTRKNSPLAS